MLTQQAADSRRHRYAAEWLERARALGLSVTRRQARKALRGAGGLQERIEEAEWVRALGLAGKDAQGGAESAEEAL